MKEVIGKSKLVHSTLPRKTVVNKNVIFEEKHIANAFNKFFINIGPKSTDDIPTATRPTAARPTVVSKTLMKQ